MSEGSTYTLSACFCSAGQVHFVHIQVQQRCLAALLYARELDELVLSAA